MKFQPTDDQLSKAQQAAYCGGQFAASYWPEARKGMVDGATIDDYRIKCEGDLALSLAPDERGAFMKSFLEGFNGEITRRTGLHEPGFVDAGRVPCAEAYGCTGRH